jgi:hypothetical protein
VTPVGSATVRFNGDTATFTSTVNGVTQVKTISRQPFGGPSIPSAPPPIENRVEENVGVTFSGPWTASPATFGWSGGSAMQSSTAGAKATITFTGTSIRWLGARGRKMGIALVSVDGGPPRELSTMGKPNDIVHTPIVTIDDLSPGQHTLTITVAGRHESQADPGDIVVVDAFDIQPGTTISHWQDSNPGLQWSGPWTKSSVHLPYSGSGVQNLPELAVTAQESETPVRRSRCLSAAPESAGSATAGRMPASPPCASTAARPPRSTSITRSRPTSRSCSPHRGWPIRVTR